MTVAFVRDGCYTFATLIIQCDNLVQGYGATRVLHGVSLEVARGCTGLLGPNGAGKSTLIKSLLGQLPISPGRIQISGRDPALDPRGVRQRIGYMPENDVLLAGMNGLELTSFCGELSGMRRQDAISRAHEVLAYVGLGESRYRDADGYSTGMRQRLRLACALVHGPAILILDEPTTGLDPTGREEILDLIDGVAHRAGTDVLVSSHILKDIERTCDHVVVLNAGRVLFCGTREAFQRQESHVLRVRVKEGREKLAQALRGEGLQVSIVEDADYLEVELPPDQSTDVIWVVAQRERLQVRHLAPATGTLDEAFERVIQEGRTQ